jgi:LPS O-antigen subunit length determinant protein (WzzB/FepE family)
LRPIVPHPNTNYLTQMTQLKEDGTVDNITIQSESKEDFEDSLKRYILTLNPDMTYISRKKVFDDLKIKKDRKLKFPLLQQRPEIKLVQKS